LNLMERVWRDVKEQLNCHRWWAAGQARWEATTALFAHLTARFHQTTRPGMDGIHNFCASA
jgi:hypothetical protein